MFEYPGSPKQYLVLLKKKNRLQETISIYKHTMAPSHLNQIVEGQGAPNHSAVSHEEQKAGVTNMGYYRLHQNLQMFIAILELTNFSSQNTNWLKLMRNFISLAHSCPSLLRTIPRFLEVF